MYKKVAIRPEWLKAGDMLDVYSLSNCISENFADYTNYWKHNGYWLFDSPVVLEELAANEGIDLSDSRLFYYEAYQLEFDEDSSEWTSFSPEPSFGTNVRVPTDKHLEGFDVATFSQHNLPECSPLSCNLLADEILVNEHCLFRSFAEAREAIERGLFNNCEPGPFRIIAVYTVEGDPRTK
jgi:hypothetical protein